LPARNLNRELVLVAMSQIAGFTLFNEVHVLAMIGPYKENQQYLSMKMLHCRIMPLKDEALQHLWQTLRFLFTLVI
jgi:cation transport regulator ChaC